MGQDEAEAGTLGIVVILILQPSGRRIAALGENQGVSSIISTTLYHAVLTHADENSRIP